MTFIAIICLCVAILYAGHGIECAHSEKYEEKQLVGAYWVGVIGFIGLAWYFYAIV